MATTPHGAGREAGKEYAAAVMAYVKSGYEGESPSVPNNPHREGTIAHDRFAEGVRKGMADGQ